MELMHGDTANAWPYCIVPRIFEVMSYGRAIC
jgi:hypothetical protein